MVHEPGSYGVMLLPARLKIEKSVLAAALVDLVVHGSNKQTNNNLDLDTLGKSVLTSNSKTNL